MLKFLFSQLTPEFLLDFDLRTTIQPKVKKFASSADNAIRNALRTERVARDKVDEDPNMIWSASQHSSSMC